MVKQVTLWIARSILVGLGYIITVMIVGAVLGALGVRFANASQGAAMLPWLFAGGIVIGLVLGPIASRLVITRTRHVIVWTCVVFFNIVSLVIEGAFYAPAQIGGNLPALVAQQFLLAVSAAILVTWLFAPKANALIVLPLRAWYDWLWRLVVSAASYLVFYFIFGAINYALVTKPYYDAHAGGLAVPAPETVVLAESVRGVMIMLSVLPFLLTLSKPTRVRAVWTGSILFAVGGIVPLLFQANSLPMFLLIASGIEIFFQNFSTGVVAGLLLGRTPTPATPSHIRTEAIDGKFAEVPLN